MKPCIYPCNNLAGKKCTQASDGASEGNIRCVWWLLGKLYIDKEAQICVQLFCWACLAGRQLTELLQLPKRVS